ncbi:IclR family transcriptional regulator C-terminal domain-containing protein [Aeromicrobium sp. CTD01-1L150]|uniref:IclR family transcriptional regulator domain-containing protein n=1 Tax=Aeromicrobium sp. CTD01-1L150 TaxID=3341830 RepID=UPI0035BF3DD2
MSQRDAEQEPSDDHVASLERGIAVIEVLSGSDAPLSLAEVARLCETTRATARRLLLTLSHLGYVTSNGTSFALRPSVMELGDAYLDSSRVPALAHSHLQQLSAAVRDTCSLTVLDGYDVVYVDRVKASRIMTVNIDIGTRFPAYATSTGRVLLSGQDPEQIEHYLGNLEATPLTPRTTTSPRDLGAAIEQARRDGHAIADQELDTGLRSIAAPVRDSGGLVIAALNVSTHVTRTSLQDLRSRVLPLLLRASEAISTDIVNAATSESAVDQGSWSQ